MRHGCCMVHPARQKGECGMSDAILEVSLSCGLCGASNEQHIPMPNGWDSRYRSVSDETAFCPEHAIVAQFADSQCPGCVGGWGDCPLWQSFAYSKLTLVDADFDALSRGICPKRVNGSMVLKVTASGATIDHLDLRDPPVVEAGKALATAILQYAAKYHKDRGLA